MLHWTFVLLVAGCADYAIFLTDSTSEDGTPSPPIRTPGEAEDTGGGATDTGSDSEDDCVDGIPDGFVGFTGFIQTTFCDDYLGGCVEEWAVDSVGPTDTESCPDCVWAFLVDVVPDGYCPTISYQTTYALELADGGPYMRYCGDPDRCRMKVTKLTCEKMEFAGSDEYGSYVGWFDFHRSPAQAGRRS